MSFNISDDRLDYVIFGIFCIVLFGFLIWKRQFITHALCEGDKPSSKRLGGFFLIVVICFNETFTTLKTMKFEFNHLLAMLAAVMLCWGITTMPQILEAWRGAKHNDNKPADSQSNAPNNTH